MFAATFTEQTCFYETLLIKSYTVFTLCSVRFYPYISCVFAKSNEFSFNQCVCSTFLFHTMSGRTWVSWCCTDNLEYHPLMFLAHAWSDITDGKTQVVYKKFNKTNKQTKARRPVIDMCSHLYSVLKEGTAACWHRTCYDNNGEPQGVLPQEKEKKTVSPFLCLIFNTRPILQSVLFNNSKGTAIYESREHQICFGFLFCVVSVKIHVLIFFVFLYSTHSKKVWISLSRFYVQRFA